MEYSDLSQLRSYKYVASLPCLRVLHVRQSMNERPSGTREHILRMLEKYRERTAAMIRAEKNGDDNDDYASPSQDFTHETQSPYVPDMNYYSDDESDYQVDTGYNVATELFGLAETAFSQPEKS